MVVVVESPLEKDRLVLRKMTTIWDMQWLNDPRPHCSKPSRQPDCLSCVCSSIPSSRNGEVAIQRQKTGKSSQCSCGEELIMQAMNMKESWSMNTGAEISRTVAQTEP